MDLDKRRELVVFLFLTLVLAPLAAAATLILGRMYTELIIVAFRIAENLQENNRKTKE